MSRLEDLEKELYEKDEEEIIKRRAKKPSLPEGADDTPFTWDIDAPAGGDKKKEMGPKFFKILGGVLGIVALAAAAVFIFLYLSSKGTEAKVTIRGRDAIQAGEVINIPISFKNISRATLENLELAVVLPPDSRIIENGVEKEPPSRWTKKIEDLKSGQEEGLEITVRFFGKEGDKKQVEAVLLYQSSNLQARFSSRAAKDFTISSVPLAVSWEGPETVSQSQNIEIKVHYISTSDSPFNGVFLKMEYPSGFTPISLEPKSDIGETIWKLGNLTPGTEGVITLKGVIDGNPGDSKIFRGSLGYFDETSKNFSVYSESVREVNIASDPISVKAFVNGQRDYLISTGELLNVRVHYQNNSSYILKNIFVQVYLESGTYSLTADFSVGSGREVLSYGTVLIQDGGAYDPSSDSVLWKPGSTSILKELAPGMEGDLNFSVRTKDSFPIRGAMDKNTVLRIRSTANTADVPTELEGTEITSKDILDLKSKSKVLFAAKSLFRSPLFLNTGPLPPKTGQETTYAVIWEIRNFSNDLENAEVRVSLPSNVKWKEGSSSSGVIAYNKSSNEVVWNIGKVSFGAGILTPVLTGGFKLGVIPVESDIGNKLILTNQSVFTARDSFTREDMTLTANPTDTELKGDVTTSLGDWKVVK